ncbi:hypothetical protein K443DRAFT_132336 [Laccaria amethystina LaAM-08-1]|uniref:Meiotic nuclear division protein 1 n=1 Tax=Laccaria amethystina LaAM-08-1 TaxID=1095629 RepID=A0A0C9WRZ1_9AGAR|nr:hypothetical protein K443DRAFT_132336 [Laccaria amethystina LaAM-08-1]
MKGIVSQSIKEVLQSLVDDGLVQTDKIGSSNFFWSFPSQQGTTIQARLNALKETHKNHQIQILELRSAISVEESARLESEARSVALAKLSNLRRELDTQEAELNAYGDSNPAKVDELKRAVFLAKEAALRWTDNYGTLAGHFTRQNGVALQDVRKYLEIGEDYEDIC